MARDYKRQVVQYERYGAEVSVQKRSKGKEQQFSLCQTCASLNGCNRVVGLGNFCKATQMTVVVWECPNFISMCNEEGT